jgi:hypothetical protein
VQQPDGVAGIDAHKQVFSVAVLDGRGGRRAVKSFATSPEGLTDAVALLDSFEFAIGRIGVGSSRGVWCRKATRSDVSSATAASENRRSVPRDRRREHHDGRGAQDDRRAGCRQAAVERAR